MRAPRLRLALVLLALALPGAAPAQQDDLKPVDRVPGTWPRDVPLPQAAKPVAAAERGGGLVVLFQGFGKAQPLREAYEAELPKRGWKLEGSDKVGDEQGLFAVQGERTLSLFFREVGPELRIQAAYLPKTPAKTPPTAK
jgi:hypothetical protein